MLSNILLYMLGLAGCFLLWTFVIYCLHRLSHIHHPANPLWRIHVAHHKIPYLHSEQRQRWPSLGQYFFWLGDWKTSLDVFLVMTVPLIIISIIWPQYGIPLLVFHYLYEVFLSESVLDHNPHVKGRITRWFAWGDFHLHHHIDMKSNYGLMITLWDRLFGTAHHTQPGAIENYIQRKQNRRQKRRSATL